MYLKRKDFYKLEKAINLLQGISQDDLSEGDIDIITSASDVISLLSKEYKSKEKKEKKKRTKPFVLEQKYVDYLNSIREELVKAEKIIDYIKGNKEWKNAYDYLSLMCIRGKLKTRATKENGYTYVINAGYSDTDLNQKHINYINNNREELIKAEKVAHRIKSSKEWKKCQGYFILCKKRGLLECSPTKENGYIVKAKDFSSNV